MLLSNKFNDFLIKLENEMQEEKTVPLKPIDMWQFGNFLLAQRADGMITLPGGGVIGPIDLIKRAYAKKWEIKKPGERKSPYLFADRLTPLR